MLQRFWIFFGVALFPVQLLKCRNRIVGLGSVAPQIYVNMCYIQRHIEHFRNKHIHFAQLTTSVVVVLQMIFVYYLLILISIKLANICFGLPYINVNIILILRPIRTLYCCVCCNILAAFLYLLRG